MKEVPSTKHLHSCFRLRSVNISRLKTNWMIYSLLKLSSYRNVLSTEHLQLCFGLLHVNISPDDQSVHITIMFANGNKKCHQLNIFTRPPEFEFWTSLPKDDLNIHNIFKINSFDKRTSPGILFGFGPEFKVWKSIGVEI